MTTIVNKYYGASVNHIVDLEKLTHGTLTELETLIANLVNVTVKGMGSVLVPVYFINKVNVSRRKIVANSIVNKCYSTIYDHINDASVVIKDVLTSSDLLTAKPMLVTITGRGMGYHLVYFINNEGNKRRRAFLKASNTAATQACYMLDQAPYLGLCKRIDMNR